MQKRNLRGGKRLSAEDQELWDGIVEWGLIVFVFLFPLVYSPFNFDGYGLPRLVLFRAVFLFLGLIWFIKVAKTGKLRLIASPVLVPLSLYVLVSLFSVINSIHPRTSFYGNHTRYEGFFTIVNYTFLFLLAANFGGRLKFLIRLFRAEVASAALVAIFGLYQYVNSGFSIRAFSTFLNPDFLGYYLVMILPAGMGLLLIESNFRLKILWLGVSIVSFACLVVTFTRGAWLGFLASVFCIGLMLGSRLWKERRIWVVSLLIFLLLSGVGISYLSQPLSTQEMSLQRRLASVVQFTGGTARARIELWRSALQMVAQRPLLGWGPDTLSLVYPRYKSSTFIRLEGSDVTPDKTHNDFLQISTTKGLMGLATYLWFLIALFVTSYCIFRNLESRGLKVVVATSIATSAGYLVAIQFLFSEISFSPFFWMSIGLILAAGRMENIPDSVPGLNLNILLKGRRLRWSLFIIGMIATSYLLLNNGKILLADYYVQRGRETAEEVFSEQVTPNAWAKSQIFYQRAITLNSSNPFYFLSLAGSSFQAGRRWGAKDLVVEAIDNFKKAAVVNDRVEEAYLGLGDAHFWMGKTGEGEHHWKEAERAYRKVINLDPYRALAYFKLGQLFIEEGQLEKAIPFFGKAIRIDFRYEEKSLTAANELQEAGRLEEAERIYQELLSWNPRDADTINDLAVLWAQTGRLDDAIQLWNRAINISPSSSELYFNLALAYEQKERRDLAAENYRKALNIDPRDERAREGLERLSEK